MTDNATLAKRIAELERQLSTANNSNQELAAQVEALREALLPFASTGLPTLVNGENYSVMHDRVKDWFGVSEFVRAIECFNTTPQQHLAEIRAEAGKAAWIASAKEYGAYYVYQAEVEEEANQYAYSIRQEVK